jgi:hypothetical protein
LGEHPFDGDPDRSAEAAIEVRLGERFRKSGGDEERVLIAKRDAERAAEPENHLAARLGAARFEEAHVSRRDIGREREIELAEPATASPILDEHGEQARFAAHFETLTVVAAPVAYLER